MEEAKLPKDANVQKPETVEVMLLLYIILALPLVISIS